MDKIDPKSAERVPETVMKYNNRRTPDSVSISPPGLSGIDLDGYGIVGNHFDRSLMRKRH